MSSKRIYIALGIMAVLATSALLVQYRAVTRDDSVRITAEQVDQMITSMPEEQRNLYADPESRGRMLGLLQEAIIFGSEARLVGYANRPEYIYQMQVQRDYLLSTAYRGRNQNATATGEEIDAYFRQNPGAVGEFLRYNPQFQRGQGIDERLKRQLGEIRVLSERARQQGLDKDPGVALQLTYFPDAILREALLKDLQEKARASDEEIREFYGQHKDEFVQVRARHILFSTRARPTSEDEESFPTAPDREEVRRKAMEVLQKAKAGEDFSQLAKEYSEDPGSRDKGGDLDYFGKGQMTPKFEEAAFTLSPGSMSDLVETPFGFHIIRVEDRRLQPLDQQMRGVVENRLRRRKHLEMVKQIKSRHTVVVEGAKVPAEAETGETTP